MMSQYEIPYINYVIREFANRFKMTRQMAYNYLSKYDGLSALVEFYDVEHLQSIHDTIDDMVLYCKNHGGHLE